MKELEIKEMYDKGTFNFLGLEISFHDNTMQISQRKLIDKVLRKFNITDCNYNDTPMEPKQHTEPSATFREELPYKELIGYLIYLMMGSRSNGKVLKLVYVDSHSQVADVLTKALPYCKFQFCVTGLGVSKLGGGGGKVER
ncbi:hypothetical protein PR048_011011, partial [Dryococelus australis]